MKFKFRAQGQIIHVQGGDEPSPTDPVAAFCSTTGDAEALVSLLNMAADIGDAVAPIVGKFMKELGARFPHPVLTPEQAKELGLLCPSAQGWETPCAASPDGRHCRHWYDDPDATCCYETKEV